jgi:hypothetical protein
MPTALLLLTLILALTTSLPCVLADGVDVALEGATAQGGVDRSGAANGQDTVTVYVNDISSFAQLEYPGHHQPHLGEDGRKQWYNQQGQAEHITYINGGAYKWMPDFDPKYKKWYFFNQQTRQSVWEPPHEMGWRRVQVSVDDL